jgi:hypothetical protein
MIKDNNKENVNIKLHFQKAKLILIVRSRGEGGRMTII